MFDINHEIKVQASIEKTFKALSDRDELKAWHTAQIEKTDAKDIFIFQGTEKPTFTWKIIPTEMGKTIVWECIDGPGDSAGTNVVYTLSKADDHRTLVELKHTPWPDQSGNFRKCNTLWGILLHHLKKYLETGKSDPAIL